MNENEEKKKKKRGSSRARARLFHIAFHLLFPICHLFDMYHLFTVSLRLSLSRPLSLSLSPPCLPVYLSLSIGYANETRIFS